jgi:quercetin dioxygenase-like cupin family protein
MTLIAATVSSLLSLAPLCAHVSQERAAPGPETPAVAPGADSQKVQVTRVGSQPSRSGPAENFTGSVRVDPLFQPVEPSRVSGALVTFEPGARTAWHTHPLGQTLVVTAGSGWVQQWGGPVQVIRPGDVVTIPSGQKHWHGATATTGMTHIAIQEQRDGKTVGGWKVSDEHYRAGLTVE